MRFEATDQALAQAGRLQVRLSQAMRAIESARTVVRWSRLSRRATSRLTRAVQDEARSSAFSKQIALARKLRFIGSVPRSLQPKADSGSDLTAKLNWLNRVFHSTPVLDASRGKENEAGSTISVFATLANKRAGSVVEKGSAGIRDGQFANARKHLSQLVLRLFQDNLPALLSGRQRGDSLTKAVAQGKQSDRLTGKYRFGFGKDNKVKTGFGKIASRYHPLSVSEVSTGPRIAKSFLESTVASSDALAKLTKSTSRLGNAARMVKIAEASDAKAPTNSSVFALSSNLKAARALTATGSSLGGVFSVGGRPVTLPTRLAALRHAANGDASLTKSSRTRKERTASPDGRNDSHLLSLERPVSDYSLRLTTDEAVHSRGLEQHILAIMKRHGYELSAVVQRETMKRRRASF